MTNHSKIKTKAQKRSGKEPVTRMEPNVVTFSSRGAVGGSVSTGNYFINLNEAGMPFTASAKGKYKLTTSALDLTNYFASNLFGAYDYYRVTDCETTLTWTRMPTNGVAVAGEVLFVFDNDSRDEVPLTSVLNRSQLQTRMFTNSCLRHVVKWKPFLVEDSRTEGVNGSQVDYVQPRNRWLNTDNVEAHRFGTLRLVGSVFDGSNGYPSETPTIEIRHRVTMEMKGLRSVQPQIPSIRTDIIRKTLEF